MPENVLQLNGGPFDGMRMQSVDWPPAERIGTGENGTPYYERISMSALTDDQAAAEPHIIRGAVYEWRENRQETP